MPATSLHLPAARVGLRAGCVARGDARALTIVTTSRLPGVPATRAPRPRSAVGFAVRAAAIAVPGMVATPTTVYRNQLLDMLEAGPKMRKWYGQEGDGREPKENDFYDPDDEDEEGTVLITDADSKTGQLVVMQAILARLPIRVLCKDGVTVKNNFGPYVKPFVGDVSNLKVLAKALDGGVTSIICTGRIGKVVEAAEEARVPHIVLLSHESVARGGGGGIAAMFAGEDAELREAEREAKITGSVVPYTVVRVGDIKDTPGGSQGIAVGGAEGAGGSQITRQDAADVLVGAAARPRVKGTIVGAKNDAGAPLPVDYDTIFSGIAKIL